MSKSIDRKKSSKSTSAKSTAGGDLRATRGNLIVREDKRSLRILIMEDDEAILEVLSELLTEEGHSITASQQMLEIDQIKQLLPDLVMLDLVFNGEDEGSRFLDLASSDPDIANVSFLVLTGASHILDTIAENRVPIMLELVEKPFDLDELLLAVDRCTVKKPEVMVAN